MKKHDKFVAALAVLLILTNSFPVFAAEIELPPEKTVTVSENALLPDKITDETPLQEPTDVEAEETASLSDNALASELSIEESKESEEPDMPLPDEAPLFCANIEYSWEGYVVKGTFTEFPDNLNHIHTLYSLDGDIWQECREEWDLQLLGTEDPSDLSHLQTQICLYDSFEPLKSYLAGSLDCFYLKLRLTLKDGRTYESQTAVIDRGEAQPVPEGITLTASFAPSMGILERNPFKYYGRYQITVNPTATPEDIITFLPDTLPIKIDLQQGIDFFAGDIIDCPVTWKSLSLPPLIAGESVTITDAAEEIVVPGGTMLRTPLGVFRLDEPLAVNQNMVSDEVRLVLNVTAKDGNPTGVLSCENNGLEAAFDLKPTGATAIHAYAYSDQETGWVELPDLRLLDEVNSQPSTANSGYALVLRNDQEPYRSYLEAEAAENTPTPFIIGLKIEGGVYNGRQLVLTWPDTYELPPDLPEVGGAGGNENNAGSDNKDDSTEEGQRPNLPQKPEENSTSKPSDSAQTPNENQDSSSPDSTQAPEEKQDASSPNSSPASKERQKSLPDSSQTPTEQQNSLTQDSSRTNKKQNTLPGNITDNGNQQNQGNERTSDSHKDSPQASMVTPETAAGNNAGNSAANPTVNATTENHAELAILATLPAEVMLTADQNGIHAYNTRISSHGLLLLMSATAVTVICITAITAGVTAKKKNIRKY
ncbi:MAG: hypothetical protein K2K07_05795 [Lachnospiraceae bacterium]|nr:hypothetical protein [Lachnospiraceae bacterium]